MAKTSIQEESPAFKGTKLLSEVTSFRTVNYYNESLLTYDLYMAVISDYHQGVRKILLSHPDIDLNTSVKGATLLSLSLYKRHFDIFSLLMKNYERNKKLDLNKCSKDHLNRVEPPLITSCRMHFLEGVVSLVTAGADIDATDNFGHTALWIASRQQLPDLVEYLISNGASVNKTDRYNYTPLLTALMYRVCSMTIKTLIINGSNLEGARLPSADQPSPLFWAAKQRNAEIVKLILTVGVSTIETACVRRALTVASEADSTIISLLYAASKAPQTLRHICKRHIRGYVSERCGGKNFIKCINDLPLPFVLKQYLLAQYSIF